MLRAIVEPVVRWPPVAFVRQLATEIGEDDVSGLAAEMSYRFLFALFPFFIFLAALLGFIGARVGQANLFSSVMVFIGTFAPGDVQQILDDWVSGVVGTQSPGLLTVGAAGALWGAASGVGTLMKGLNRAYDVDENRPFWQAQVLALLTTVALAALVAGGAVLYAFGEWLGAWLAAAFDLGAGFLAAWSFLRGPGVAIGLAIALVLLYAALPNTRVPLARAVPGAVVATVAWVGLTLGFSFYVHNFGSYDRTFGSLGTAVVLMVWMYAVGLILLVGGEINAVLGNPVRARRPVG